MSEPARALALAEGPRRLRSCLYQQGITVLEFAEALGVSKRTASRWSMGRTNPSPELLAAANRWMAARGIAPSEAWRLEETSMDTPKPPRPSRPGFTVIDGGPDAAPAPAQTPSPEETPMQISREFLSLAQLKHFNLLDDPFEDGDDPEDIWMSPALTRVENAIVRGIRRRHIMALVAGPGSGKSTLVRRLYGRLGRERAVRLVAPASLDRPRITPTALAVAILRDLTGQETSGWPMEKRSELLRLTLKDMDGNGIYPLLVIDEAHLLTARALLSIKQLWDSHILFRQLAVLLVGQLPLKETLQRDPRVRELTGRTRLLELSRLGPDTADYLTWRFSKVGAKAEDIFEPEAVKAIGARAESPLWINNLAVYAMAYAHQLGFTTVTAAHVGRAI